MSKQILNRRDTAANWTSINPVLGPGEIGVESDGDNPRFKLGDGTSAWSELDYFGAGSGGGSEISGNVTTYTVGPNPGADFATFVELFEFLNNNRNVSATTVDTSGSWPEVMPTEIVIDLLGNIIDLLETEEEPYLELYGFNAPLTFVNGEVRNAYFTFKDCLVMFMGDFWVGAGCYIEFYGGVFSDGGLGQANDFRWGNSSGPDLAFQQGAFAFITSGSKPTNLWVTFYQNSFGELLFDTEGTNTLTLNLYDNSDVRVSGNLDIQMGFGALAVDYGSRLTVEGNLTVKSSSLAVTENSELSIAGDLIYDNSTGNSVEYISAVLNSNVRVSGTVTFPANAETGPVVDFDLRLGSTFSCKEAIIGDSGDIDVDNTSTFSVAQQVDPRAVESHVYLGVLPESYDANQTIPESRLWADNGVLVTKRDGVEAIIDRHLRFNDFVGSGLLLGKTISDYYWYEPYANTDVDEHINQPSAAPLQILSWNGTDYEWVNPSAQGGYGDADVDIHLNSTSAAANTTLVWNGTDYEWVAPIDIGYGDDDVKALLNVGTPAVDKVLSWNGTDFVWVLKDEPTVPTGDAAVLALVDFDVATVPEITDTSTYGNEILFYLRSGTDLATRFPDTLLTEYEAKFGTGSLAISFDPFGLPVPLGSGDFCLEFWLKRDQFTGNGPVWSMSDPGGDGMILELYLSTITNFPYSGKLGVGARRSDGSQIFGTVYGGIETNVSYVNWTHVAFYRLGDTIYLGINGVINVIVLGDRAVEDYSLNSEMCFGNRHPTHPSFDGNDRLGGGFDDIRITVGDAVPYPAGIEGDTYDIPTEAHPAPGSGGGGGNDARISDTQITNWDEAYGWGDHSVAGYLTEFTEADPTVPQHVKDITTTQIANWDASTGGGGAVDSVNGQTGVVVLTASDVGALPDSTVIPPAAPVDSVNGQTGEVVLTASDVGALPDSTVIPPAAPVDSVNGQTGAVTITAADLGAIETELDPTVPQHVKDISQAQIDAWDAGTGGSGGGNDPRITTQQITEWDEAHGWGDHSQAGYLTDFTEADPTVPTWVKSITEADIAAWNASGGDDSRITTQQIAEWDEAYGWGNHSTAGYLTEFTELDPTVPTWVKDITQEDIAAWNADPAAQTIVEIGAEPVSPIQGDLWLNDGNSTVYIFDAGNWLQFPIGEAGEVTSAEVVLGEGGALLSMEYPETLTTQADANKYIQHHLDALYKMAEVPAAVMWEETEDDTVIKPAGDKRITATASSFGSMSCGTMASEMGSFRVLYASETLTAATYLDTDGNNLLDLINAPVPEPSRIDGGSY